MNLTREEKLNLMLRTLRKLRNKNLEKFTEQEAVFKKFVLGEFNYFEAKKIIKKAAKWKT